jgi:hypothetical protein
VLITAHEPDLPINRRPPNEVVAEAGCRRETIGHILKLVREDLEACPDDRLISRSARSARVPAWLVFMFSWTKT